MRPKKNPLPGFAIGSGFWKSSFALLDFCQRREHDRQPATCVVVTPRGMMAVIAKHDWGLIPESRGDCQRSDRIYTMIVIDM